MSFDFSSWLSTIFSWLGTFVRHDWLAPTAVLAAVGIFVNQRASKSINREKIAAEEKLADKKFGYEHQLTDKKFEFDKYLAQHKFDLDKGIAQRKSEIDKDQLVHKRRFELAEALLADTYHFRDLMNFVRNGASFGKEGSMRVPRPYETEGETSLNNHYYTPQERLIKEDEFIMGSLFAKKYTAQAQFGLETAKAFQLFNQSLISVQSASQMLIAGFARGDRETTDSMLKDIWMHYSSDLKKDDQVGNSIDEGVAIIEKPCKPVLEWKGA